MSAPYASKEAALQAFWAGFGIPARDENSVPDDAMTRFEGHYITYCSITGSEGDRIPIYGSIWWKASSWDAITEKCNQIAKQIGRDGVRIPFVGGVLWIVRGVPFSTRMTDTDDTVRRVYINLTAEYISAD